MGIFDKSKEFLDAAKKGDVEQVKQLLKRRIDVNKGDGVGYFLRIFS